MYTVNVSILFALIIITFGIGLVLGILLKTLRSGTPPSASQPENKPTENRPNKVALPTLDLEEIVRFERRKSDNALVATFADGERLESPQQLSDLQRRRLIRIAADLKDWLVPATNVAPRTATRLPASVTHPVSPPQAKMTNTASASEIATKDEFTTPQKTSSRERPKPVVPAASIAAQVDEILQEMLAGTPLENKAIRLMELPGQGMVVMVGLHKYETVDEVPDEAVRAVIRAAVQRWEKKMEAS